ncbi:hypothetical protein TPHA_0E03460 [Tetrapisispora phaffii CBS 4417]|uniref:Uncharacterized protein n=1 Tax=Tetrapisispora phaffii (strain ATCC 24235 / CBS 4417 / NBRC 1672 / NRRL Y-8282 / UCD 70-5) TaxID=1071381 RepID=G8BU58_TETPH|nr:hypothetical protein TPHA_0E03460 [Tetrapisispora phaffii CBS 4417]CCE63436.1 hypothetical protein TPHA_0E03460 [Tetrapisispora phaffii CBS 4417]
MSYGALRKYSGSRPAVQATFESSNEKSLIWDSEDNIYVHSGCEDADLASLQVTRVLNNPGSPNGMESPTLSVSVSARGTTESSQNICLSSNNYDLINDNGRSSFDQYSILSLSSSFGLHTTSRGQNSDSDKESSAAGLISIPKIEEKSSFTKKYKIIDDWCLNNELKFSHSNNNDHLVNINSNCTSEGNNRKKQEYTVSIFPSNSHHLHDSDLYTQLREIQILHIKNFIKGMVPILRNFNSEINNGSINSVQYPIKYSSIPSVFSERDLLLFYSFKYDELNRKADNILQFREELFESRSNMSNINSDRSI